jgi:hypothetical protein
VFVAQGTLSFKPVLLREQELTDQPTIFRYIDVAGQNQVIDLPTGSLAYTFCQVPVVYIPASEEKIKISDADGGLREVAGNRLDAEVSRHIFSRDGYIKRVTVYQPVG